MATIGRTVPEVVGDKVVLTMRLGQHWTGPVPRDPFAARCRYCLRTMREVLAGPEAERGTCPRADDATP